MRFVRQIAVVVCLFVSFLAVESTETAKLYRDFLNLSSKELLSRGDAYSRNEETYDSALVCYTILGNRYSESMPLEEKMLIIDAYANKAFVYYFYYFDYTSALENVNKANEIMESVGIEVTNVYFSYGIIYSLLGNESKDEEMLQKGVKNFQKALELADKEGDLYGVNMNFGNLMVQSYSLGITKSLKNEWEILKKYEDKPQGDNEAYTKFNLLLYSGLNAMLDGLYKEAERCFDTQIEMLPRDLDHIRFIISAWEFKSLLYARQGDYRKALACLDEYSKAANEFNVKDAIVDLYRYQSEYYGNLGMRAQEVESRDKYLSAKDSLFNYKQMTRLYEMEFLKDLSKAENTIREQKESRRRLETMLVVISVILLIIIIAGIVIFIYRRQVSMSNKSLYARNREIFNLEQQERTTRNEYQRQVDSLKEQLHVAQATNNAAAQGLVAAAVEPVGDDSAAAADEDGKPLKYCNSSLTEESKNEIMTKILKVMEDAEVFCAVDFSLDRLTELVAIAPKHHVSQVINEKYNCNFNVFLNNFRIREACQRISDNDQYGHLTFEALAETIGFKSRTTFVTQFKRVTGLTPSQYQQEAGKS